MVLAADDMRHAHFVVVHDDSKVKERLINGSRDNEIFEISGVERDFTADEVAKRHARVRIFESYNFFVGVVGTRLRFVRVTTHE